MNNKLKLILIAIIAIIILAALWFVFDNRGLQKPSVEPFIDIEARQQILLIMNYLDWENPEKVAEFNKLLGK